MSNTAAVI